MTDLYQASDPRRVGHGAATASRRAPDRHHVLRPLLLPGVDPVVELGPVREGPPARLTTSATSIFAFIIAPALGVTAPSSDPHPPRGSPTISGGRRRPRAETVGAHRIAVHADPDATRSIGGHRRGIPGQGGLRAGGISGLSQPRPSCTATAGSPSLGRRPTSRISTLRTLPVTVIGNSSTISTYRGILNDASWPLANSRMASAVRLGAVAQDHPGAKLLAVALVRHPDDLHVEHVRMGVEELLDLARRDVLPPARRCP